MKTILFFAILLGFAFQINCQNNDFISVKFNYPNGKVSSEGFLRNEKPDGYWKSYYESGNIKSEGNRKNYLLDSTWIFYSDDGKISSKINYKEGKKDGLRITFNENETIEELFVNDIKESNTKIFYKNHKLKKIIPFEKGLENGYAFEFNEDSIIILIEEYKRGFLLSRERINRKDANGLKQGLWKDFYKNNKLKSEITYLNDMKNGYFKKYDSSGTLVSIEKYINDEIIKHAEELKEYEIRRDYYPNGRVMIEGSYYNGKPDGIRREYDENGKITNSYIFYDGILSGEGIVDIDGFKQGPWKEYYEDGNIMSEGVYKNNLPINEWKYYHKNGKIEQQGKYSSKGLPVGEWKFFYPSGNILKKEFYVNGELNEEYLEYSDSGNVIVKGFYNDGLEDGEWYFAIGDVIETGNYLDGVQSGMWTIKLKENDEIIFKGKYFDGKPDGKHVWLYDGKIKKMEGSYYNGLKEGVWKIYNPDGSVLVNITYRNGVEIKYENVTIKPEIDVDGNSE